VNIKGVFSEHRTGWLGPEDSNLRMIIASKSDWMARAEEGRDPDPILQLMEEHKRTIAEVDEIVSAVGDLEESLPKEAQQSDFFGGELTIVPSDDPRWIDITRRYFEAFRRSDEIALQILSVEPTTLVGASALLTAEHVEAGCLWPDGDEARCPSHRRNWLYFLTRNVSAAISRLTA